MQAEREWFCGLSIDIVEMRMGVKGGGMRPVSAVDAANNVRMGRAKARY
jgi:hypothetical protein